MTGFELEINGRTLKVCSRNGVATIIATAIFDKTRSAVELDAAGSLEGAKRKKIHWGSFNLKEGDKVSIRVKEMGESSDPVEAMEVNELSAQLRRYRQLEKELKEAGVLNG